MTPIVGKRITALVVSAVILATALGVVRASFLSMQPLTLSEIQADIKQCDDAKFQHALIRYWNDRVASVHCLTEYGYVPADAHERIPK